MPIGAMARLGPMRGEKHYAQSIISTLLTAEDAGSRLPSTAVPAATGDPDLGARLRALRKDRGLALKAVAANAGISLPFLSEIERGQKLPSLAVLARLAPALGTSVVQILSGLERYDG